MKRFFDITGPDGKVHRTELRKDKRAEDLLNYLTAGLEYLSARGLLKDYHNPETAILVGNLPTKRETERGHIYSAFREEIDGQDTIVMDDTLGKEETIYQMAHELIHGLYPNDLEHEIQIKTARVLKNLAEQYPLFTNPRNEKNFRTKSISANLLSKEDFEKAYRGLMEAGAYGLRGEDLEGRVMIFLGIGGLLLSLLFLSSNFTGFAISNFSVKTLNIIGMTLFLIGLLGIFFYLKKKS